MMNAEDIAKFRAFIQACESDASILHQPQLAFFKAFLERLGATVPPAPRGKNDPSAQDLPKSFPTAEPNPEPAELESESEESDVELDNSGVVEPDTGDPQPMGDSEKEVTEEDQDRSGEKRSEAQAAFCDGDFEKAADLYTEAIIINPVSALFHAKRAACYLKLQRPCAAVRDCDKAIQLNPDSATAYKFRGRAYRLLGKWEEAANDLRTACKLDFDEQADEWLKEVTPNTATDVADTAVREDDVHDDSLPPLSEDSPQDVVNIVVTSTSADSASSTAVPLRCSQCNVSYRRPAYYQRHMRRVHQLVVPVDQHLHCEVCSRRFSSRQALSTHRLIHSGQLPFQCDRCGCRFRQRRHLDDHSRTHSGDRPFRCDQCPLAFATAQTLRSHVICCHGQRRPHACPHCESRFCRADRLRSHLVLHAGTRPAQCPHCQRRFVSEASCRRHVARHHPQSAGEQGAGRDPQSTDDHEALQHHLQSTDDLEVLGHHPQSPGNHEVLQNHHQPSDDNAALRHHPQSSEDIDVLHHHPQSADDHQQSMLFRCAASPSQVEGEVHPVQSTTVDINQTQDMVVEFSSDIVLL